MSLEIVSESTTEPITATLAKAHLRVTHSNDDTYIGTLITIARHRVEIETGRALVPKTLRARFDSFPVGRVIQLEQPPLTAVASILYDDADGAEQIFSSSKYSADLYSTPGRVILDSSESWATTDSEGAAVRVLYDCGYADGDAVPTGLKAAMYLLISHLYSNREAVSVGVSGAPAILPMGFDWLVGPYRVHKRQP